MSGKNISFLIFVMWAQVYLLQARSLGSTRPAPAARWLGRKDGHPSKRTASAVTSSCSPSQDQLEYYNQLHISTAAINGLSGNTLYYTHRAMEDHNNRTVSTNTTVTVEDNATIANITDQSRFTPAGMEPTNKVVCAQILQELDAAASVISNTAVCPWEYVCNYKADRYPHYLFKARCKTSICSGNCSPEDRRHNECQLHGIHVTVLQMRNCGEWVWGEEVLPIACTCTNDAMMKD